MADNFKSHEQFINQALNDSGDINYSNVAERHLQQIQFLQHERLIHLLVTITFAILIMLTISLSIAWPHWGWLAIIGVLLVTELFYLKHYYWLENTVQRWYGLYDQLIDKQKGE